MFSNDAPSEMQRCRVFNTYVIPTLKVNKTVSTELTKEENHILFVYDFRTDECEYEGVFNFSDVRNKYIEADKNGGINHFKNLAKQLKAKDNDGDTNFYINVFHYGAKGYFHPSMYKYYVEDIEIWDQIEMMGEPEETTEPNPWFSNIKDMFNWELIGTKTEILTNIPDGDVVIIMQNNCKDKGNGLYLCNFESYMNVCKQTLVPLDMQAQIKSEYEKGKNLLIVNIINYLDPYFLLARINNDGDKCSFTFL
jgi:hypothetical protein